MCFEKKRLLTYVEVKVTKLSELSVKKKVLHFQHNTRHPRITTVHTQLLFLKNQNQQLRHSCVLHNTSLKLLHLIS